MKSIGVNARQLAKAFDCTERTITQAVQDFKAESKAIDMTESEKMALDVKTRTISDIKKHYGVQTQIVMDRIACKITDEDIRKASLRDKAIAYGVFFDKMAITQGISNEIVDHRHVLVGKVRVVQEDE